MVSGRIGHSDTKSGEMTKNQTFGVDSEDDDIDDDYDIAEANCELAMVEGQLCNIPYEVYDLLDLTGVLSIKTWNSILTEEERFFLSTFLPDMDQETFGLTMQELLGGANLCFGNPVDEFYKKLRGGLFTPKVSCSKEGVMFLRRNIYYYSLKYYHEKLIKTFTEMQRVCDQYGKALGSNTRLLLWSERRKRGNLNKVPSQNLERKRTKSLTFPRGGGSKDTLKFKITEKGIFRYQSPSYVSSQEHHHQILPKGILKVIPKPSSSVSREEPYLAQTDSTNTRFAASPYLGSRFENPYGTIACSITELPRYFLNHQDASFRYLETTRRRTEPVLHDPTGLGASYYSIKEHNLPTNQEEYVHYHMKSPGFNPRILDTGSEAMETKKVLYGNNFQRTPLRALSEDNHARETDDNNLFSMTYKRRKVQRVGFA